MLHCTQINLQPSGRAANGLPHQRRQALASILITGGTGSLGSALVDYFLTQDHYITILSKDPHKQERMRLKYDALTHDNFVLADICDRAALQRACIGQDILIHTAAQKILQTGETDPIETMRVNYLGTANVAWAWRWAQGKNDMTLPKQRGWGAAPEPRVALLIQSDKAVMPVNLYGFSKAAAERVWLNDLKGYVLRYGNVVGSEGSFIHEWQEAAEAGRKIIIREPTPTRFFLTMTEAVALVVEVLDVIKGRHAADITPQLFGGKVYVPHAVPAFSLLELGNFIGQGDYRAEPLLPGEKQHEVLIGANEAAKIIHSPLVSEVCSRYDVLPGEKNFLLSREQFNSSTAVRLTPEQVLERLSMQKKER